jgi:hypothetical protein
VGRLLRDRAVFLAFLQERWPIFVKESDGGRALAEDGDAPLRIAGPIFSELRFAEECVAQVPGSRVWQHPGLPSGFIPVVAPAGKAFVAKGTSIVCHGGDSLEELAVPFVLMRTAEGGAA